MGRPIKKTSNRVTQYAGIYTLDLYCDHDNDSHEIEEDNFPAQFNGETFNECAKQARDLGWALHLKNRTASCPLCNRHAVKKAMVKKAAVKRADAGHK